MKTFALISTLLSLTLCAGCMSTEPQIVVKTVFVKEKVPANLIQPCPRKWHKKGGPAITEDFAVRGDVNEAGLVTCSAQVDGVRAWNAGL